MLAALGLTFISMEIIGSLHGFIYWYMFDKSKCVMYKLIHAKMARLDPAALEYVSLHDDMDKASVGADWI